MADRASYVVVLVLVRYGLAWTDIPGLHRSSRHDRLGRSVVSSTSALAIPFWFIYRQRYLSLHSCGTGSRENLVLGSLKLSGQVERTAEQWLAADGAIACFSSNIFLCGLNADRAPQLKAIVRLLAFPGIDLLH